jgi:hypothetical protein
MHFFSFPEQMPPIGNAVREEFIARLESRNSAGPALHCCSRWELVAQLVGGE